MMNRPKRSGFIHSNSLSANVLANEAESSLPTSRFSGTCAGFKTVLVPVSDKEENEIVNLDLRNLSSLLLVDREYLGTMVFVTLIEPPQDVRHRQENTKAYINCQALDTGSLLIAESCLAWVTTSGMGFSVEYPAITMHAISRDLSRFPEECLCVILDNSLGPEVDGSGESGSSVTELRFAPEDTSALTSMFQTMSACQRLHPDLDVDDDEEDEDAEDENESDLELMPEDDQVIFQRTEPVIQYGPSDGAGDVQHLEAAVGQLMSNGGAHNASVETSDNEDQFEDAECDH